MNPIEVLMRACGVVGVVPRHQFESAGEFEATMLVLFASKDPVKKKEQLEWIGLALREAERSCVEKVAACIRHVAKLE